MALYDDLLTEASNWVMKLKMHEVSYALTWTTAWNFNTQIAKSLLLKIAIISLGDLAAAENCHIQALRIRQRHSVTSWHPEVITSLHNLMILYIADQKFSIATEYAYEICKVCQKIHGMRDARTVKAFRKLTELSKRESQGRSFDLSHEHVERLSSL